MSQLERDMRGHLEGGMQMQEGTMGKTSNVPFSVRPFMATQYNLSPTPSSVYHVILIHDFYTYYSTYYYLTLFCSFKYFLEVSPPPRI